MKLLFIGDVMLGRLVNEALKVRPFSFPWGDVLPIMNSADVRICNLECALSDGGSPAHKTFTFRSDAKNVEVLKAAGIDVVTLANNHALDYGPEALADTLGILDSAHILQAGAGRDLAEKPIDLILHTPGGYVIAAEQIAEALARHKGHVAAFVPYYALSADEIFMDEHAILGRINPQLLHIPAQSLKKVIDAKGEKGAKDASVMPGDMARKAIAQVRDLVWRVLKEKSYSESVAETVTRELVSDIYTHDAPVFLSSAQKWGLRAKTGVPETAYDIVKLSERA